MPDYKPIHLTAKAVQRSKGHNIIAKVAYRACERIKDEHTGKIHDYREKGKTSALGGWGVLVTKIFTQDGINSISRFDLWTKVNNSEKRKDACTGREYEFTMPEELQTGDLWKDSKTFQKLCDELAQYIISENGNAVDYAIHPPNKNGDVRNIHCHMMTTTRQFKENSFGEKVDFEKQGQGGKKKKSLENIRQKYVDICNKYIKERCPDIDIEYTKESYETLGIDKNPTIHMGYVATEIERKGRHSFLGDINRQIKQENTLRQEIILVNEKATNQLIEKSNSRIAERKREFASREFNVKYIVNGSKLNARQRATRLSLIDENKRRITDTNRAIANSKRTATDTDRVIANTVNEFEQRKLAASSTDQFIGKTDQYINKQRIEHERQAQLERERQERQKQQSIYLLENSLIQAKNDKYDDYEANNIAFYEFLKHHEPLPREEVMQRFKTYTTKLDVTPTLSFYSNGLMSVNRYERGFEKGSIRGERKYFETSDIVNINTQYNSLEFKNVSISLKIDSWNMNSVSRSIKESEQHKRQPAQAATPTLTLEQPRDEENTNRYRPKF